VDEYNASLRIAGMEALGKGFGGLLGGLGEGMQTQRYDTLANQLKNQAEPPRAMAVNPALQGAADTTVRPGQIPYDVLPMNQGGAFTGGMAGLKIQQGLDTQALNQFKADTGRQRMIDANLTAAEKAEIERQRLEETVRHHQEIEEARAAKTANDLTARASKSMNDTTQKYKDKVKETTNYNNHVALTMHNAATAKTDEDWQKNVDLVTNHYNAMTALGYELPFPEIPPSPSQRTAAQEAAATAEGLTPQGFWHPFSTPQAQIDAAKAEAAKMPGAYQYPGLPDYQRASPGEFPSTNLQDYMPSAQQPQAPAPSAQQPQGGGGYASPADVKAAFQSGKINQDQARGILKSQFGFE
jgi:hypothetical protein